MIFSQFLMPEEFEILNFAQVLIAGEQEAFIFTLYPMSMALGELETMLSAWVLVPEQLESLIFAQVL